MKSTDSMFDGFGGLILSFIYALIGIVFVAFLVAFAAACVSIFYNVILSMFIGIL